MKKLLLITCMLFTGVYGQAKTKDPVHILSIQSNVIYIKVDKELLGASIEIFNEKGVKLITQKITDRKFLIDFHHEQTGKYEINIINQHTHALVDFVKTEASPLDLVIEDEEIIVTQGI